MFGVYANPKVIRIKIKMAGSLRGVLWIGCDFVRGRAIRFRRERQLEDVTVGDGGIARKLRADQPPGYQLIKCAESSVVSLKVLDLNGRKRLQVLNGGSFIPGACGRPPAKDCGDAHYSDEGQRTDSCYYGDSDNYFLYARIHASERKRLLAIRIIAVRRFEMPFLAKLLHGRKQVLAIAVAV